MSIEQPGFQNRMAEYDIAVRVSDARSVGRLTAMTAELTRGPAQQRFLLVHGHAVRLTDLAQLERTQSEDPVFVWTDYVPTKTADSFRRAGVRFADEAGNAWLEFGDVLIDIRGRRSTAPTRGARASATGDLFSAGRAQVVCALLAWPDLWEGTNREVATGAGVSVGLAHDALALLRQAGYEPPARLGTEALLDNWAAAFPTGLARKLELATYHGDAATIRTVNDDDVVAVGGEAAAREFLRPTSLTVYVDVLDGRLPVVNRWRADGEPNIVARRKFWTPPVGADEPAVGVTDAPWPLVYADLVTSEDVRVRNAARDWKDRFVQSV